ncbi:PAS domain-containing sensor histidine kinase (modular protein) [Marinoscillum sp. 108]|nr:PAS domain-containing sensor histidine kinase (modular protein) [Marinoscillum sp. 108]
MINLSGRQRMLSQKITRLSLAISITNDSLQSDTYVVELEDAWETWKQSHDELEGAYRNNDYPALKLLFDELEVSFNEIDLAVGQLLKQNLSKDSTAIALNLETISENEPLFLSYMDQITFKLDELVNDKIDKLSRIQLTLLIITLVFIALEIFLVLRPKLAEADTNKSMHDNMLKMINQISDYAIIFLDKEGKIQNWNSGAERIHGYIGTEMIGHHITVFSSAEDQASKKADKQLQVAKENGIATNEEWIVRKDKSGFWAKTTITAIYNIEGNHIGFGRVTQDLTEAKKTEQAKVLHAKNKELEEFTYIVSHDLKVPVRTISNYIEIIREDHESELSKELLRYINSIDKAAARMQALIHGLLDYSLLGKSPTLEPLNLNQTLKDVREDLNSLIQVHDARISVGELPNLNVYPVEMRQLFQNLITNAIKFRKDDVAPVISIEGHLVEGFWKFSVKDNGIGIEEKQFEKIFIIFQRATTESKFEGQGIGLANCKKITEMHGGRLWVESEPGIGSTFYFTISSNLS